MRSNVNRKGVQMLAYKPEMHVAVTAWANIAADIAKAKAPKSSGHYAASIQARHMGYRYARARIYSRDFKAYWIEFGAGPSPVRHGRPFRARHVLSEAAIAAGLKFDPVVGGYG